MTVVTVLYSCPRCGLLKRPVDVAARLPDQDVLDWMDRSLRVAVSRDHARTSPSCDAPRIDEVLVPMAGRHAIGSPFIQ